MSGDHGTHYRNIVKGALKEAALGEPFGFFVEFVFMPKFGKGPQSEPVPLGIEPAWFISVDIRAGLNEQAGNGVAVWGFIPSEEALREAAVTALEMCRKDRDKNNASSLEAARAAFRQAQVPK